ncbi:TetR family transcriptional regulator [bacterium]|nr:TetR family transcriptional regulator [bacterium]
MTHSKNEAQETRRTIILSALKLFSEKGFDATSISEICRNANITKGALYWHFKDKHDLYYQLISEIIREVLGQSMFLIEAEKSPIIRMKKYLNNYLTNIATNEVYQEAYRLLIREMQFDQLANIEKLLEKVKEDFNFEHVFQQAIDQGELPETLNANQYYELYTHMFDSIIINWLWHGKNFDLLEWGNQFFDYVYRIDLLRRDNEV